MPLPSPKPKCDLKPKPGPKSPKIRSDLKIYQLLVVMKLFISHKLCRNNNDCVIIIVLILRRSRRSVLQSYLNYAFIASTVKGENISQVFVYLARYFANL